MYNVYSSVSPCIKVLLVTVFDAVVDLMYLMLYTCVTHMIRSSSGFYVLVIYNFSITVSHLWLVIAYVTYIIHLRHLHKKSCFI